MVVGDGMKPNMDDIGILFIGPMQSITDGDSSDS